MTKGLHAECMRLLNHAKRGDEAARKRLVDIVSRSYSGMVRRFYTADPILDDEDIRNEFYWAIWRAIDKDDGRGDQIFYLAQAGTWAVKSLITVANKRRHGTAEKEGGVSVVSLDEMNTFDSNGVRTPGWEPVDDSMMSDPQGVVEIHERRGQARDRVMHILVHANLAPRHEEILQLMLDGEVDLDERLARKEIASKLGVSGQRVTQILNAMEDRLHTADAA